MVFESKNAQEFGWSLAVPTGRHLQAAAEGEMSLKKDVAKGMWIIGAVMSTYAFWTSLPHSGTDGHGHLIAMTDSKTVKQRFKGGKVRGTPMMQTHSLFIDALEA
jgi:hypothetical protein